jgi:hypothetical protein
MSHTTWAWQKLTRLLLETERLDAHQQEVVQALGPRWSGPLSDLLEVARATTL